MRTPFTWNSANFSWNSNPFGAQQSTNPFTWDDVALITEIAQALGGGGNYQQIFKDPKKKKHFIKLLCKVQGKEYEETKETTNYKIVISDVSLVVSEVLGTLKIDI
tara:strand:+ start:961 stop:1278 length:318 start_codon:yes stop_codon:yes gene_type:complete